MSSREQFEAFRETRNAQLESEGHLPGSSWHVTNAHYSTWQASRACATPEWEHAPDWANWLAMDSLGHWWWFEVLPEQRSMMWTNIWGSRVTEAGRTVGRSGWTETLEPRP